MKNKRIIFISSVLVIGLLITKVFAEPNPTKIVEVGNTAPVTSLSGEIKINKKADIIILTDYTSSKLSSLQTAIDQLRTTLFTNNVAANIKVIDSNMITGTQSKATTIDTTKTVSQSYSYYPPASINYNDGTSTGTLYASGSYTTSTESYYVSGDSFTATDTIEGWYNTQGGGGYYPPGSISYNSGGYSGTLSQNGTGNHTNNGAGFMTWDCYYSGTVSTSGYWSNYTVYNQIYTGTVSAPGVVTSDVKSLDFSTLLNSSLQATSDKYLLLVSDGSSTDYFGQWGTSYAFSGIKKNLLNYVLNNNFAVYSVTPASILDTIVKNTYSTNCTQEYTLRQAVNSSPVESSIFALGQYQNALNLILSKYSNSTIINGQYLVRDEETITYNKGYSDYENDPIRDERFRFIHNNKYFENDNGILTNANSWINSTLDITHNKGMYQISYQAQDNATSRVGFEGYNLWSKEENQLTVYVHDRPFGDFNFSLLNGTVITLTNNGYDLDHLSEPLKGIVAEEWKWKKVADATWTNGKPSAALATGTTYSFLHRVKDLEGAWSLWVSKTIVIGENNPPVANFSLNTNNMTLGSVNNILEASPYNDSDPDGDPIAQKDWSILTLDNLGNVTNTQNYGATKPNLATLLSGRYRLRKMVKDNPSARGSYTALWSELRYIDFIVQDYTITGQVNHTEIWNTNRIKYNKLKTGTDNLPRTYDVFFPGENFALVAFTTPGGNAQSVRVTIATTTFSTNLVQTASNTWTGDLWDETMLKWPNKTVKFTFVATYPLGITKTCDVDVKIDAGGGGFWLQHREF